MNVEGILRAKGAGVVSIRPDATVGELISGLRREGIGAMVVSGDLRSVDGIVSERDVVHGLAAHGPAILGLPVREIMTRNVVTCGPTDTVKQLMEAMTRRRIRHLPVVSAEGKLSGIISIGDVVKNRLEEMETETNVLREAYLARQ